MSQPKRPGARADVAEGFPLEPAGERVFVLVDGENGEERDSGLYIPAPDANAEEQCQVGTIMAAGPKARTDYPVGTRVFFRKYGPQKIEVAGTRYVTLEARDVLARFRG